MTTSSQMKRATVVAREMRAPQVATVQVTMPVAPLRAEIQRPLIIDTTENMILQGHLVPRPEFQALMGWTSPRSLTSALAAHRIFAMDFGEYLYFPVFFADAMYNRRHLAAVTKQLGNLPGGAKLQFFGSRKGSLSGQTPLEALAAGRLEMVLRLAAAYAES